MQSHADMALPLWSCECVLLSVASASQSPSKPCNQCPHPGAHRYWVISSVVYCSKGRLSQFLLALLVSMHLQND